MALPENKPDLQEEFPAPSSRAEDKRAGQERADLTFDAVHSPARALQARLASELTIGSPAPVRRIAVAIMVVAIACSFAAFGLFSYDAPLSV